MSIPNSTILDPVSYEPGFISKCGEWVVVPYGSRFMLIHKGQQVQIANSIKSAKSHIERHLKAQKKNNSSATLEEHL